jgi:hypothetical protein
MLAYFRVLGANFLSRNKRDRSHAIGQILTEKRFYWFQETRELAKKFPTLFVLLFKKNAYSAIKSFSQQKQDSSYVLLGPHITSVVWSLPVEFIEFMNSLIQV